MNYFSGFLVYELQFLTQSPQIAPNGPNTLLNRYNLTLRWSRHFSMVFFDVKYRAKDFELLLVFPSILQNRNNAQNTKKQVDLNPEMALRI